MCLQGLAVLGHSLAALQVQPSAAWLSAYMAAAASQRLAGTPAGCSVLMHTLGVWQQLGLLQQQQLGSAAGVGPCSSRGVGRAVDDVPVGAGAKAAAAAVSGAQAAAAAAAGQQLQVQAQQLAEECLRCFRGQGHSFTAEQFGMFCKGLAQWGIRVGPQLGEQLEQVSCIGGPWQHWQPWHDSGPALFWDSVLLYASHTYSSLLLHSRCFLLLPT